MSSRFALSLNVIKLSNVLDDLIIILTTLSSLTLADASEICGKAVIGNFKLYSRSAHGPTYGPTHPLSNPHPCAVLNMALQKQY